jgi:hypothetical protein
VSKNKLKWIIVSSSILIVYLLAIIFNRGAIFDIAFIASLVIVPILFVTPVIEYILGLPMTLLYQGSLPSEPSKLLERKIYAYIFFILSIGFYLSMLFVYE